jgi:hypothetical protein
MKLLLLPSLIFCALIDCFAQTGTIQGQVYDRREKTGLANAYVKLLGINIGTISDLEGNFKFDSVPPGVYNITARYIGYGDTTLKGVVVKADSVTLIQIILPPPCSYDKTSSNKTCPICGKKNKVVPIVYGLPIGPLDNKRYYYAGCVITNCDPNWYCKRDKHKF